MRRSTRARLAIVLSIASSAVFLNTGAASATYRCTYSNETISYRQVVTDHRSVARLTIKDSEGSLMLLAVGTGSCTSSEGYFSGQVDARDHGVIVTQVRNASGFYLETYVADRPDQIRTNG